MGRLEQIKAMKKERDIQSLLDGAYSILENPIAMFDTNYSLIAYTDVVTDDPIWNELISTGTFSKETQEAFANTNFTYSVTTADKIVILKSDDLAYDRVHAYVFNRKRIKVAQLVMVECNTSLTADDIVAFNALADKITSKIRDDEHYTEFGDAYLSSLITRILDGEIRDTRVYAAHIKILYEGFESYFLHLAVIELRQGNAQNGGLEHVRDLLMEKNKSCKFAIYSGYIVMVMASKHIDFDVKHFLSKNRNLFEQFDLYAGVSSCFENLYELLEYYVEAVAALKVGRENKTSQRVALYGSIV